MAATAHSDPYSIFMRKIGYSVGLENTLFRFDELTELYVTQGDITLAMWKNLVHETWGLKNDHIADVFYSLGFIQRLSGDVLALENLDAAALCKTRVTARNSTDSLKFLLLWAIMVNDGEIFVNLLLSDFEQNRIEETISNFVAYKRSVLLGEASARLDRRKINKVVNIERQEANKGGAGDGRSITSLKRTQPLQKTTENSSDEEAVRFSPDYFRKVPRSRRDWAKSLNLWSDDVGITPTGSHFINCLRRLGYITELGVFVFWPMEHEFIRSGFNPHLFGEPRTLWDSLVNFAEAYCNVKVKPFDSSDVDEMIAELEVFQRTYRGLHVRKALLRREMAITVVYPALVATACAGKHTLKDIPRALELEQKGEKRRVNLRRSRNTGGAISVKP